MITDKQDPIDKGTRQVFRDGVYVGFVYKLIGGGWVARDIRDQKLTERRPGFGGEREYDYFEYQRDAIAAFGKISN